MVAVWKAKKPGAVENEIKGWSLGYTDPLMPGAQDIPRYETVGGVGDQAMLVIETADEKKGIVSDVAMLVAQRGDQLLMFSSRDLPRRERAEATTALTTLAHSAVKRL